MGRGGGGLCGRRRAGAELDALCLSSIARFKRPKDYVFVEALPKNNYGKILKTELRDDRRPAKCLSRPTADKH